MAVTHGKPDNRMVGNNSDGGSWPFYSMKDLLLENREPMIRKAPERENPKFNNLKDPHPLQSCITKKTVVEAGPS